MRGPRVAVACAGVALLSPFAHAQRQEHVAMSAPLATFGDSALAVPHTVVSRRASRADAWWTPVASAAVPGAGQALLSQDRFIGYLAIEAYGWLQYAADSREGWRQQRAYRELARKVARAYFGPNPPDGDFEYYERMEHFVESGVYDLLPGGKLEPETDTTTFNGAQWLLARQTFWTDPDTPPDPSASAYRGALEFYERRAIRPEYRWSWRNAQLEQDLFGRTIARSNAAFRNSVEDLGLIIANHALSTVDAYVTLRLRRRAGARSPVGVSVSMPWAPFGRPRGPHRLR